MSADEAILCATERCPDMVLMDIRIKAKRDGIEAADILRRQFGVPVVYLTAHADQTTLDRAMRTEPYGYLIKPVKTAELRSAIEMSVHKHEMARRLRERDRWSSTALRSVADAAIAVDIRGHVVFMNTAAEALTGLSQAEAPGRPAQEVVRLRAQSAGGPHETPLEHALRARQVVRPREDEQ